MRQLILSLSSGKYTSYLGILTYLCFLYTKQPSFLLKFNSFLSNSVRVFCIFKTLIIQSNYFFLLMVWCFQLLDGFEELTVFWCQVVLWILILWPITMASVRWYWQSLLPKACQSIDPPLQFYWVVTPYLIRTNCGPYYWSHSLSVLLKSLLTAIISGFYYVAHHTQFLFKVPDVGYWASRLFLQSCCT